MRTLALITLAFITNIIFAQTKQLKIETGDQTIIYPFYLETKVVDENNDLVYNTNDLFADDSKTFTGNHTVKVYTHWGSGEDVYEIKEQGKISFTKKSEGLEPIAKEIKNLPEDRLLVVDKNFTTNKNGEFNADLTFEKNIIFNYTDGEIEVTQNQIPLQIISNVVQTSEGFLSIHYDPSSKEYHYEVLKILDDEELLNL
jgi:hypothetical protein